MMGTEALRVDRRRATSSPSPAVLTERLDVRISVLDPVPLFVSGLLGILRDHGFTGCSAAQVPDPEDDLLVVGIRREEDWSKVSMITEGERSCVVAIVPDAEPSSFLRAIGAGVSGVAPRTAAMEQIVAVVECALVGLTAVPPAALRQLADRHSHASEAPALSEDQLRCLERLADGETVAQIARGCGYSERETYRMLERIYRALGVRNRSQALVKAGRGGLV